MGRVILGDQDDAGGLLVQTVDDAGTKVATHLGERIQVVQQRVDQRAVVAHVLRRSRSGMHHHSGRLVDDRQVLVLMQDVERDVLREGVQRLRTGGAFDLDGLATRQLELRLGRVAVDADLAGLDQ